MIPNERLSRFISADFRSVWALELLLYLRRRSGAHGQAELVDALRASDLVVRRALDDLIAVGLVIVDDAGDASFVPATSVLAELTDQAQELYAKRPDAVRRMIVRAASPQLTTFADAFRLRKP